MTIYCKQTHNENGEYVDANGTRYSIDWGHNIQAPDGKKNEELGYKPFSTLDEAAAAFGLTLEPLKEPLEKPQE